MIRMRLKQLPRDARDTLFSLLVITWTILPHVGNLAWWCTALSATMLLWRMHLAISGRPLPSRWVVGAVLVLTAGLTLWSERSLLGKDAGVTMLVVLMTLKSLELRGRRDAMVMFFLGFFLVLTHFLYSQSLLVALSMVLSVWGLLTALVLAHMPVGRPALPKVAALAARTALLGAPVMVALFLLFPRMGPLWGVPQDAAGHTGLSGSMRLGAIASLANDDSIALRVRFYGRVPEPQEMYFRGPVLSIFNGRDWQRLPYADTASAPAINGINGNNSANSNSPELRLSGQPLHYEMTLEPSRLATLPLLEITPQRKGSTPALDNMTARLRPDMEWVTDQPVTERLRFDARSWPQHQHGPLTMSAQLFAFLELPDKHAPGVRAWALELGQSTAMKGASASQLANALLAHIRRDGFTYTMDPGLYGADAIEDFWLSRKLGFCEHFAASFVFIMRTLQVPARVVTGYQGSDPEPVDGYHVVRQSHAHAWAEYWQAGTGWVRADPTAAVAPERIRMSRQLPPSRNLVEAALNTVDPLMAARLRSGWEAMNNRWNQYVLNYSSGLQFDLLRQLGVQTPNWQDLLYALSGLLVLGGLAGAGWALLDRARQDPWLRLQRKVQVQLAAIGVAVQASDAPRARAAKVRAALGAEGQGVAEQLDALDHLRYASPAAGAARLATDRAAKSWWAQFTNAVAKVRRQVGRHVGPHVGGNPPAAVHRQ